MSRPKKASTTKRPAARKTDPDKAPDQGAGGDKQPATVKPLNRQAFGMVMEVINNSAFKGDQIEKVVALKLELARVTGI